jgi:hypothetical protein
MCSSCRIACVGISGGCVAPVSASGSRGDRSSRGGLRRADSIVQQKDFAGTNYTTLASRLLYFRAVRNCRGGGGPWL